MLTSGERMNARLILEDGRIFRGVSCGAAGTAFGEVVFNTAMSGYQEILTDPSYHFQLITMTAPQIGNYGVNPDDNESGKIYANGFIVREMSPVISHWKAHISLEEFLKDNGVVGISNIDTRALTIHLRDHGSQMGLISTSDDPDETLLGQLSRQKKLVGRDIVKDVTTESVYDWNGEHNDDTENEMKVAALDFGIKHNILRQLSSRGCSVKVFPANTDYEEILAWNPDGIFLSNGPGDPEPVTYAVSTVKKLLGKIPVFGICLGHQILGLAFGGKTRKLKFGHHGANHPVKHLRDGRIEITSQNHGFIVDGDSLPDSEIEITHINLNDNTVEGMRHRKLPAFSVQYHPESSPGPHDSRYLFDMFINDMRDFNAET